MKAIPRRLANLSHTAQLLESFRADLARALGVEARPELCPVAEEAARDLLHHELRRMARRISS
jgi:hypothetical protein